MDTLTAVFLGIVQGLTEFLPISSSGHLVILQHLAGMTEPALFFDICVHMGTLVAVILFFRQEIGSMLRGLVHFIGKLIQKETSMTHGWADPEIRLVLLIVIGSVPTGIIGLVINAYADQIFASPTLAGWMLIVTGLLLWGTRMALSRQNDNGRSLSVLHAISVGTVQGLAALPGISRSGSTIAMALYLGVDKETAGKYSFLLSIPAILGAQILGIRKLVQSPAMDVVPVAAGTLAAAIVGYLSLALLIFILKKGRLHFFAPYCWLAGILAIWI